MARVEFEIWLKDLVSGGLRKTQGNAHAVFTDIGRDIAKTQGGMGELGKVVDMRLNTDALTQAGAKLDMLQGKLMDMQNGGRGGKGGGGIMGGVFFGGMAMEGAMMAARAAKKQVTDVFGGGMEAGMTKMELNVLAGDAAGNSLYGGTKKYIANSMFGPELFEMEKELLGYGEQAKEILPLIKQMGDISIGNIMKMGSLTEVLGKVEMYGHFQQAFMRQLATTGFNPVQEIYRATGKKVDPDDITAAMYKQAMIYSTSPGGRFNDMMQRMMETPGGKERRALTNIAMEKEDLGVKLQPVMGRFIEAIEPMIDKLPGFMDELEPPLTKLIDGFKEMLPYLSSFGKGLWDLLKPIGEIFISPEFKGAMKGLLDFGTELEQDLLPLIKGLAGAIKGLLTWLPEDKNAHKYGNLTGYYFSDTTGSGAKGLVPDMDKIKKVSDSLVDNSFYGAKVFDNWKALDMYNRTQSFNNQTSAIKAIAMPMMAAVKSGAGGAGSGVRDDKLNGSDEIMSGGSRQIVIKDIHIGEKMVNHFTDVKEGAREISQVLKQELAMIFAGLPGMQ